VKLPPSWVLVMDGAMARLYRTTGESGPHRALLAPVSGGAFSRSDPAHFGPRPGKNFASALRDSGHGVTTHESRRRRAEEEFVGTVLAWIEKPEHLAAFQHLVIAAPARCLGEIRHALSAVLAARLHREIHGDLTKLPIKELEQRVLESMLDLTGDRRETS
jgi:protein required for attachment to host cells